MVGAWVGAAWGNIHVDIMRDFVLSALTTIEKKKEINPLAKKWFAVHNNRAFEMNAIDVVGLHLYEFAHALLAS